MFPSPRYFRSLPDEPCFAFATLSVALVLGTAGSANAFFGLLGGGCGGGCCEPSCGCEQSCACEPSCGCDSGCGRRRCCLFGGLRGLFHRHNNCCCEASCGCEEAELWLRSKLRLLSRAAVAKSRAVAAKSQLRLRVVLLQPSLAACS